MSPTILKVKGTKIVDGDGKEVILRGAGLGGWMKYVCALVPDSVPSDHVFLSMENFISGKQLTSRLVSLVEVSAAGYPANEAAIRAELANVLGKEKSEFFFDKVSYSHPVLDQVLTFCSQFLEYFFQEDDAKFFKASGLNCIRLAVNYRHWEGSIIHSNISYAPPLRLATQMT
jgi:hypothetical protein